MEGWIKLHRVITESAVFNDAEVFKVWIYLLCEAATVEHQRIAFGVPMMVKVGQVVTGRKKLSVALDMAESKVYRALNILKKLGNITIEANNRFSLITVENWAKYQGKEKKVNSQTTAKQHHNNSEATAQQQQGNSRTTHNKNVNKVNKENKGNKGENNALGRGTYKNVYLSDNEYEELKCTYPNDYEVKIERLSKYMADTGKNYSWHFRTIVEWIKKDGVTPQGSFETDEFFEAAVRKGREKLNDSGS